MKAGAFFFFALAAVAVVVRKMAANDAGLRWPVTGSPCEDPEL